MKMISYLRLVLIFFGLIFNTSAFLVFRLSDTFKSNSSLVYLSFISIADFGILFTINLDSLLVEFYGININTISLISCRIKSFVQYSSMQGIGILYSFISLERFIMVYSKPGSWLNKLPFTTTKSAFRWAILITIIVLVLNVHALTLNGYVEIDLNNNSAKKVFCHESNILNKDFYFVIWPKVTLILYCFLPLSTMIVCNCLIVIKTIKVNKIHDPNIANRRSSRQFRLTISFVLITILFLLMTAPGEIFHSFFYDKKKKNLLNFFYFITCLNKNLKKISCV